MIPIRCDSHVQRFFPVTLLLLATCVGVFILQYRPGVLGPAFVPLRLTHSLLHPGRQTLEALLSCGLSFFMHGSLLHLASNMWYLWIFGNAMEHRLGGVRFLLLYLFCGTVAMLVQAGSAPFSTVPIVGASGAIAGLMGAHLILMPFSRILLWVPPVLFLPVPSFLFLLLWFYVQYLQAGTSPSAGPGIAWWAHIGGFVAGGAIGLRIRRVTALRRRQGASKPAGQAAQPNRGH